MTPHTTGSSNCVDRLLDTHLAHSADRVAVRSPRETKTYAELHREACRAANALLHAGVQRGDRVTLLLPDCPEYLTAVLGLMRVGAVPVPVSTEVSREAYRHIADDCRPTLAIADAEHADRAARATPVIIAGAAAGDAANHNSYAAMVAAAQPGCPVVPVPADAAAVIQYTSGSTGSPKGVIHTHHGVLAVLDGMIARLALDHHDVCFSAAKLSFGYGFGNSLLFPLGSGASTVLLDARVEAAKVLDTLSRHRVTVLFAVPTLYSSMLMTAANHPELTLHDLRLCVSAGEPLPRDIATRWRQRFGLDIVDGLGSTECLHIFIASEPGRAGAGGTVVHGYEAQIRDDTGTLLKPRQVGHLWVKSAANSPGYWNRPEDTAKYMRDGWIRTGDQMYYDEDGGYHYLARSDDVLNVGGFKVAPTEVEQCLLQHPLVSGCAVVGTTDHAGLTVLTAFVLLDDHATTPPASTRRQLRAHIGRLLPTYKRPRDFRFVTELPTTPTGKLGRHALRRLLCETGQPDPPPDTTPVVT